MRAIEKEYYKLDEIIKDAQKLIDKNSTTDDPSFIAWRQKAERFLIKKYGEESFEYRSFFQTNFSPFSIYSSYEECIDACKKGLRISISTFTDYLNEIQDEILQQGDSVSEQRSGNNGIDEYVEKKYQVFVSSTYEDLKEERALVTQCLLDIGCVPVGMEQFPASGMSQMEYIKKMLADCDYYILILAGRYGSCDTDGISFTEKEYDYAASIGMPIMSFVIKDAEQLQQSKCEKTDAGRTRLKAFREKVCKDKMVKMYSSPAELQAFVAVSMQKCVKDFPAVGWIRANRISGFEISDEKLGNMIEEYLHEHFKVWQGGTY